MRSLFRLIQHRLVKTSWILQLFRHFFPSSPRGAGLRQFCNIGPVNDMGSVAILSLHLPVGQREDRLEVEFRIAGTGLPVPKITCKRGNLQAKRSVTQLIAIESGEPMPNPLQ